MSVFINDRYGIDIPSLEFLTRGIFFDGSSFILKDFDDDDGIDLPPLALNDDQSTQYSNSK
eukprot:scaffold2472_cov132-Skeletonema_menzelii.AAC.9